MTDVHQHAIQIAGIYILMHSTVMPHIINTEHNVSQSARYVR